MWHIIALVVPVFGLMTIGFGSRAANLVPEISGVALADFVFVIAMPLLIFRTLTGAQLPDAQPWGYWVAYFTGVAITWALVMAIARRWFGATFNESVVAGFAGAQANTVMVGIPIILEAFGEAGAVPLFLLVAIHLPITMAAATILTEGRKASVWAVGRKLAHNPIILGIVVGALARLVGYRPDGIVKSILDSMSAAAIPCALVSMGMALHTYKLRGNMTLSLVVSAAKLILHPLIVYILATKVFAMPPAWSGVAVLFACCPCGINSYLFAERIKQGASIASSAVTLSTGLAAFTTIGWLWFLGIR